MNYKMNLNRDELIYMARVCEQTERFDDMLVYMKQALAKTLETPAPENPEENDPEYPFGIEERNLLSVAYKNSVGARRTAWRIILSFIKKPNSKEKYDAELLGDFKKKLEAELDEISYEIIGILDENLIKNARKSDTQVFYHKMKGDYYRYIAEYSEGDKKKEVADLAEKSYNEASEIANKNLKKTDPVRLGLALNFSVFHYEAKNDPDKACELAKAAFDDAISEIETIDEAYYKDSTTIMQLIRDNLTLWTSEMEAEPEEDED